LPERSEGASARDSADFGTDVRTFLIADIRGYTRFTHEHGDEAAANLVARFEAAVREGVSMRGGTIVEIRGDEALAVFGSARQALRAAVELQTLFAEKTQDDPDLPLRVGIGIDSGEAVQVEDGYRGAALNVAARLCAVARAEEVLATDSVVHLTGRLEGLRYLDRGRVHLKGITAPVHIHEIRHEAAPAPTAWPMRPIEWSRALGWRLIFAVCVIAAATAAAVVVLTTRGPSGGATPASGRMGTVSDRMDTGSMAPKVPMNGTLTPAQQLSRYVLDRGWSCQRLTNHAIGALASIACRTDVPDRLQLTLFRTKSDVERAYKALLGQTRIRRGTGKCVADAWAGEAEWFHGMGEPGGRVFCYLAEGKGQSYVTWTSVAGAKILAVARLDSLQHRQLFFWWSNIKHDIV
jgi:class 3 adenylate cyclase